MRYAKLWIPATFIALSGATAWLGCTAKGTADDGNTQSTQQAVNPPGNNGTVKIEETGSTTEIPDNPGGNPDNDPHVGCSLTIEFRGFDQGNLTASWSLTAQPPSGHGELVAAGSVPIGGDPAGGANDLDGTVTIDVATLDLSGLTEQPQQGFHLRLDVHAQGSQGSDQKHKVFWVQNCRPDGGASSSSSSSSTSSSSSSTSSSSSGGSSTSSTSSSTSSSSSSTSSSSSSSSGASSTSSSSSGQTW